MAKTHMVLGTASGAARPLQVGVVALPHRSSFTELDALAAEHSVALDGLAWMWASGLAGPIAVGDGGEADGLGLLPIGTPLAAVKTTARAAACLEPAIAFARRAAERDARLARWAAHVRSSIDLGCMLGWLGT